MIVPMLRALLRASWVTRTWQRAWRARGLPAFGPLTSGTALEDLEEEWEEVPGRDAAGEAASDIKSASLAPLADEDAVPAAESCLAGGPRDAASLSPQQCLRTPALQLVPLLELPAKRGTA